MTAGVTHRYIYWLLCISLYIYIYTFESLLRSRSYHLWVGIISTFRLSNLSHTGQKQHRILQHYTTRIWRCSCCIKHVQCKGDENQFKMQKQKKHQISSQPPIIAPSPSLLYSEIWHTFMPKANTPAQDDWISHAKKLLHTHEARSRGIDAMKHLRPLLIARSQPVKRKNSMTP